MKHGIIVLIIFLFTCNCIFGQEKSPTWIGLYTYQVPVPISYTLLINADNTCIYSAQGVLTYFKVNCKGLLNRDKYEIYYLNTIEGSFYAAELMDKNKPMMSLFYSKEILYTNEEQLDRKPNRGKLLFNKTSIKEYSCPCNRKLTM